MSEENTELVQNIDIFELIRLSQKIDELDDMLKHRFGIKSLILLLETRETAKHIAFNYANQYNEEVIKLIIQFLENMSEVFETINYETLINDEEYKIYRNIVEENKGYYLDLISAANHAKHFYVEILSYLVVDYSSYIPDNIAKLFFDAYKKQALVSSADEKDSLNQDLTSEFNGFEVVLSDEKKTELYNKIHTVLFNNCTIDKWLSLFTNTPKSIEVRKGKNRLLAYFLKKFFGDNHNLWKKGEIIFNTKYLLQNLTNNPYPKGYEIIDNAYNETFKDIG